MRCPKCQHVRLIADATPEGECPKCGVIYAKFIESRQLKKESANLSNFQQHSERDVRAQNKVLTVGLSLLVGLTVGFFAGREYLRYEIKSVMQSAASSVKSAFTNGANESSSVAKQAAPESVKVASKPAKAASTTSSPLLATLIKKGWREGQYGQNSITFEISFVNATTKNIRAFDGTVAFVDLLGNEILSSKIEINDPVQAGRSIDWEGALKYNQFISTHLSLRNAETRNLKAIFTPRKALFEDGEVKEF